MKTFTEWLEETDKERRELDQYGETGSDLGMDQGMAIGKVHRAQKLRDQAEQWVIAQRRIIMFNVKQEHEKENSREREIIEKDEMRKYQTILNDCETTLASCVKRYFSYGSRK